MPPDLLDTFKIALTALLGCLLFYGILHIFGALVLAGR